VPVTKLLVANRGEIAVRIMSSAGTVAPGHVGPMPVQVANGVVDLLAPDDAAAVGAARRPGERHARYLELVAEAYERGKGLSTAAAFELDDVIDPADTRAVLSRALAVATVNPADE
jgi:acetyl-CoA carboxylase carboxyltransferase component